MEPGRQNFLCSSIQVPGKDMISHFFMAAWYFMVYMYHIFFIQSTTDGCLGYSTSSLLWIVLQWTYASMSLYDIIISIPLGVHPVTGSNDSSISSFLRNHHTAFHNGWTNLHSHQQCKSIPISPHPLKHLLSPVFLMITILTGMRWLSQCGFDLCFSNDQ